MATYSLANERLRALEDIEREIGAILQNAGSGNEDRKAKSASLSPEHARQPEIWSGAGEDPGC